MTKGKKKLTPTQEFVSSLGRDYAALDSFIDAEWDESNSIICECAEIAFEIDERISELIERLMEYAQDKDEQ